MTNENKKNIAIIKEKIKSYCTTNFVNSFTLTKPRIKLHEPTFSYEEINSALDVLLSRNVTMGKNVINFEKLFSKKFNYLNSVSCNSGSSANLLAVASLSNINTKKHFKPGDEVIVSALSWSTTIWPLIQFGLVPVIVDINPSTLNIDENLISDAISKKTRGIMPVHVYGNPCNMRVIKQLAKKHDLFIIEDCCEAMGAKYDGDFVGTFGEIGTFSFYFSHHITTLEGGMCITKQLDLSERMKILRAHGWLRDIDHPEKFDNEILGIDKKFAFVDIGYNFRITELQGAFGLKQLSKFKGIIEKRKRVFQNWEKIFFQYSDLFTTQLIEKYGESSFFGFPITLNKNTPFTLTEIRNYLQSKGIETRPIICGNVALQPAMKNYKHRIFNNLPNASFIMNNSFSIGCHQDISLAAQNYAKKILNNFLKNYK